MHFSFKSPYIDLALLISIIYLLLKFGNENFKKFKRIKIGKFEIFNASKFRTPQIPKILQALLTFIFCKVSI